MCSFIVSNIALTKENKNLDYVNFYTSFRGPDLTTVRLFENFYFLHNLLSITGEFTEQPFIDYNNKIVCLYNGEIYNYDKEKYNSDGECLIDLYLENGISFVKDLDGEFAIVLFDFAKDLYYLVTDTFSTKPLWYSEEGGNFAAASYSTPIIRLGFEDAKKLKANTIRTSRISTKELISEDKVTIFNLSQYKNTFDDWNKAFTNAILKRAKGVREGVFIGLSSGYDSGAICCELLYNNIPFTAYTLTGRENLDVLFKRSKLITEKGNIHKIDTLFPEHFIEAHKHIEEKVEEFKYTIHSMSSDYNEYHLSLKDDNGSNGLSFISSLAKKDNNKIYLSGQGADEIFSDYGFAGNKKYPHSNFGGLFPDNLSNIFPWPSFFESSMESYLAKEEHVSGSYGLEARYPFLDKSVVQEFLWLSPKLKNLYYKSVLHNYLVKHSFPMSVNEKIGF